MEVINTFETDEGKRNEICKTNAILFGEFNQIFEAEAVAAIFRTTFWNAFSWMKMYELRLRFHWSLFLGVQLAIFHHWFK